MSVRSVTVRDVPITDQVSRDGSPLRRFLDTELPERATLLANWRTQLAAAPWAPGQLSGHRAALGQAIEIRIGLDLVDTPAQWPLLSFLPPAQYRTLVGQCGFIAADLGGVLPTEHTSDPLLCSWTRASHPVRADTPPQQAALALLLQLVRMNEMAHYMDREHFTVQERRGWYEHLCSVTEPPVPDLADAELASLTHLWSGYLHHGREPLLTQKQRIISNRAMANSVLVPGFATADLVVGTTLVEIKSSASPEPYLERWLDQLLGYLLCDQWDSLGIDQLAVYCAAHACLLTLPVSELLRTSANPDHDLPALRRSFQRHMLGEISSAAFSWLDR